MRAMFAIVGARSTFPTSCGSTVPGAIPGPRTMSGRWIDSSYGSTLPLGMRCSPWKNPLSDEKKMYVLSSSPTRSSARTIAATAPSTASSDSSRCW